MVDPGGISVLHVDDEPGFADMAATHLERTDDRLSIETATSASEGLEHLDSGSFDCVVSDYDMPRQNGIEFLSAVRDRDQDLPFILYTGKGSEEVASDAIRAGATDYLQKERGTDQYELLANRIQNAVEQNRAREQVAETERRLQTIAEHTNDVLWKFSGDWSELRFINEAYEEIWGRPTDELQEDPRSFLQGIHPEDRPDVERAMDQLSAGESVDIEYRVNADEDYGRWVWVQGEPVVNDVGAVETVVGFARDITERKEHERALERERNRLEALFENAPGPVIAAEIHGGGDEIRMTAVNDDFEEVFGFDADDVVGKDPTDLLIPEEGMAEHELFRERAAAGETVVTDVERVTSSGRRTFLLHIIPYGVGEDPADGLYAWFTDISARREREEAIERLHDTVQIIMTATAEAEVADVTVSALADILGMPVNGLHLYDEDAEGLAPIAWSDATEDLVGEPPTFRPGEGIAWRAYESGKAEIHDDITTVDDRYNPDTDVRSNMALPLGDHGVLLIGTTERDAFDATDVDLARILATHATTALDRIDDERTLREYETLVETVGDPMFVLDEAGYIQMANDAHLTYLGAEEEEVLGTHASAYMGEGDYERGSERIQDLLDSPDRDWTTLEITAVTSTGDRFPAEINLAVLTDDAVEFAGSVGVVRDISERKERAQELETLRERMLFALETTRSHIWVADPETGEAEFYGTPDVLDEMTIDSTRTFFETVVHPDDRDRLAESYTAIRDGETESFTAEYRTHPDHGPVRWMATEGYRQTDNGPATIIGLTTDVTDRKHHEEVLERKNERLDKFASVLSHDLRSPLNVAQGRLRLAQEAFDSEDIDEAAGAVDRSLALIDDVLTVAREGEAVCEVEPVDLAATLDRCWRTVETANATIVTETEQWFSADASRFEQLLENLIRNAVEHGAADVTVTVGDLDDRDGFYVADDGPGIPEAVREEVFDAAYSTSDDGSGLGLHIVREIADAHGWSITVTDSASGGARFEFTGVAPADE